MQRRRPPPVAEAGRSCWGSGQQDASKAKQTLGAATRRALLRGTPQTLCVSSPMGSS
nr:MAG TPA: hypothetical protein [Caudoviricetes sp.]